MIRVRNVRSIRDLTWKADRPSAGWNVILGDNGSGKSSFLRSMALVLLGPKEGVAARQDWKDWVRREENTSEIMVSAVRDPDYDKFYGQGAVGDKPVIAAAVGIEQSRESGQFELVPRKTMIGNGSSKKKMSAPTRHLWGGMNGWFSASYGPFRRFRGGDRDVERSFLSNPRLGAHLSIFGENVSLSECLLWLSDLNYKRLENRLEGKLLAHLKDFVNQDGFLPHNVRLTEVSSSGVEFEDQNGFALPVENLSDGFRSVLSMAFDLIRQLNFFCGDRRALFSDDNKFVVAPGVVMIDEVDAHLHPTWQKTIGFWLTKHFPNVQFFVTTHSPLICQAAIRGSVFVLPRPGSEEKGRFLKGAELDRLLYGDILDAYSTEAFGTPETRSSSSAEQLVRLAALNTKEIRRGLSAAERAEQVRLRAIFPQKPNLAA